MTDASKSLHRCHAGAILWTFSAQYYLTQALVASAFNIHGYSWSRNTISDLGNTQCGPYGARLVCSPLHNLMNISFIFLGATMIGGVLLLQKQLANNFHARFGFSLIAFAGLGSIMVGLFPENTVGLLHLTGAALSFALGNLGMILLGLYIKRLPVILRVCTVLFGVVGLVSLVLLIAHVYVGIGMGAVERIVSYPLTIWMTIFGGYLLLNRCRNVYRP